MGNRANVIFVDINGKNPSPCVYLHWNGGAESIYAFLDELDRRRVRVDQCYECARFAHVVGEFFDRESISNSSLGIANSPKKIDAETLSKIKTDNSNNGFYIVYRGSNKSERKIRRFLIDYDTKDENGHNTYELKEMDEKSVAQEITDAYNHEYNKGENSIANTFLKIQGKRPMNNC